MIAIEPDPHYSNNRPYPKKSFSSPEYSSLEKVEVSPPSRSHCLPVIARRVEPATYRMAAAAAATTLEVGQFSTRPEAFFSQSGAKGFFERSGFFL